MQLRALDNRAGSAALAHKAYSVRTIDIAGDAEGVGTVEQVVRGSVRDVREPSVQAFVHAVRRTVGKLRGVREVGRILARLCEDTEVANVEDELAGCENPSTITGDVVVHNDGTAVIVRTRGRVPDIESRGRVASLVVAIEPQHLHAVDGRHLVRVLCAEICHSGDAFSGCRL